ncbi:MAG: diacylglycerol kinase family protein [Planctomycetota bacterium]
MNLFLVTNPGSRNRRGRRIAAEYERLLEERGVRFDSAATSCLADAERLARRAIGDGAETVVAVGGDGTINRVLRGFFDADGRPADADLGVLYAGTSPDFCRFHDLPTDPAAAIDRLLDGATRRIDVGRLDCRDEAGNPRRVYFASSVNVGLGAGVARRANRLRRWLGDGAGTLAATFATIAATKPAPVQIEIDGAAEDGERVLNVTVGKNPFLASGLKLDVEAGVDDGKLWCFVTENVSRLGLIRRLPAFYDGTAVRRNCFRLHLGAKRVRFSSQTGPVECDGDPAGFCPAVVTILPRAVRLRGA